MQHKSKSKFLKSKSKSTRFKSKSQQTQIKMFSNANQNSGLRRAERFFSRKQCSIFSFFSAVLLSPGTFFREQNAPQGPKKLLEKQSLGARPSKSTNGWRVFFSKNSVFFLEGQKAISQYKSKFHKRKSKFRKPKSKFRDPNQNQNPPKSKSKSTQIKICKSKSNQNFWRGTQIKMRNKNDLDL